MAQVWKRLLCDFWGEVSTDQLAVLKSCDATFWDIPEAAILVTHWSGLVIRGIVFCAVDDDLDSDDDDDEDEDDDEDYDEDDDEDDNEDDDEDDDYKGGDADRLITPTVTGCPLFRIERESDDVITLCTWASLSWWWG